MPTLNWIGKDAVVKHHKNVPFRLLEPVAELSCGIVGADETAASGNLIVQGDNLHALKALLPRYAGQVKCIYIDPPYNTGNEGWAYNDNVNSHGGAILAVEYKGADRWKQAEDDRSIGGLWAELSGGRCRFVMVTNRQWEGIDALL